MQNNFNDTVDQLKNFDLHPSEQVWKEIEVHLDQKKKRRIVGWWWSVPAILLIAIVFGSYYMSITKDSNKATAGLQKNSQALANKISNSKENTSSIQKTASSLSRNTSSLKRNVSSLSNNASSLSRNESSLSRNASSLSKNTSSLSTNVSSLSTNTSSLTRNIASLSTNTSSLTRNIASLSTNTSSLTRNIASLSRNESSLPSSASSLSRNTPSLPSSASSFSKNTASLPSSASSLQNNTSGLDDKASTLVENASTVSNHISTLQNKTTDTVKPIDTTLKSKNLIATSVKNRKLSWSLAIGGGANYVSRNNIWGQSKDESLYSSALTSMPGTNLSNTNSPNLSLPKNGYHFSLGINVDYKLSKKWTLQSGLKYQYLENKLGLQEDSVATFPPNYYISNKNTYTSYSNQIQIPLNIFFCINPKNKNKISFQAGAEVSWVFKDNWLNEIDDINRYQSLVEQNKRILFALETGASINFNDKFSLGLIARKYLTPSQKSFSKYYWQQIDFQLNIPFKSFKK